MTGAALCPTAGFVAVCAAMLALSVVFAGPLSAVSQGSTRVSAGGGLNVTREDERACLDKQMVLYPRDGNCHQLLTEGLCRPDEWLVLDENPEDRLLLKCARMPCKKPRYILWPGDGKCHGPLDWKELCPHDGNVIQNDPFGVGECVCDKSKPRARDSRGPAGNMTCHRLYERGGPCPDGQLFVPLAADEVKDGRAGVCEPDPCLGTATKTPNAKCPRPPGGADQQAAVRVLWPAASGGDGCCHALGSSADGRCPGPYSLGIDPETLRPACLHGTTLRPYSGIIPKSLCYPDHCVEVSPPQASPFADWLKRAKRQSRSTSSRS